MKKAPLSIATGITLLGIIVFWFVYTIVPLSTNRIVRDYLRQQTNIQSYTIAKREWALRCCAVSQKIEMRKANIVRYTITTVTSNQQSGNLTIDLVAPDYEGIDTFDFLAGHQRWQISHVYLPSQTPPALLYEI